MSCSNPLKIDDLVDYWLADDTSPACEAIEEHFFECDDCCRRLEEVVSLAQGIKQLAEAGSMQMIVSKSFLDQVRDMGRRIREYPAQNGEVIQCTVTPEDDFLVGRLITDLGQAKQIDLSLCSKDGQELHRLTDIPFTPGVNEVIWQQSITYAKAAPSETLVARLIAVEEGIANLLGEFTFVHTRTMPGAPAW